MYKNRCSRVVYKDLGKEIYQLEVPKGVRVPNEWMQLSKTAVSSCLNHHMLSSVYLSRALYNEFRTSIVIGIIQ